jgi:hypothetical protein
VVSVVVAGPLCYNAHYRDRLGRDLDRVIGRIWT